MLSRSPAGLRRPRDLPSAHTTTKTKHGLVQPNGGWPTDAGVSNNACCWMPLRVFRLVMSHICDRMQVVLRFIFQLPILQHYHALSLYPLWHVSFGRCDRTLLLFMLSFYFTFFWGDISVFLLKKSSPAVLVCVVRWGQLPGRAWDPSHLPELFHGPRSGCVTELVYSGQVSDIYKELFGKRFFFIQRCWAGRMKVWDF